jgi:hypothetical protein
LHPVGTKIRVVCLIGSICFGLAMSNMIFYAFWFLDWDFDKNYADMATERLSIRGNFDSEVSAATSAFTNGNLALWSVGSGLHALFDNSLWSMAVCNCRSHRDGIVEQLNAYKRMGEMSVMMYVTGVAIIALATIGVRLSFHHDVDGDEDSIEAATETFANYEFMISYLLEVFISFFFFYPFVGFVFFAGFLRCIHEKTFGGRRYEIENSFSTAQTTALSRVVGHQLQHLYLKTYQPCTLRSLLMHKRSATTTIGQCTTTNRWLDT